MWRPRNFGAQADVRNFLNWLTCQLHPNTAFTHITNGPLKLPKVLWYSSPQKQWLMQSKNLVLMYLKPSALILICRREKAGWRPVSGARCVEIASLIPTMKFYLLRVDLLLRTQAIDRDSRAGFMATWCDHRGQFILEWDLLETSIQSGQSSSRCCQYQCGWYVTQLRNPVCQSLWSFPHIISARPLSLSKLSKLLFRRELRS